MIVPAERTIVRKPGKVILFGEHAVVYGQPAIAIPLNQLYASAIIDYGAHSGTVINMPDLGDSVKLDEADPKHPHAAAVRHFLERAPQTEPYFDGLRITLNSSIPIARGLGSGAALGAALLQGLAKHFKQDALATDVAVSEMTYEIEKIHHGTPSGIDNTVVSYEQPIFFVRDLFKDDPQLYQRLLSGDGYFLFMPSKSPFLVSSPFSILIADTGIAALTKEAVGDVRQSWIRSRLLFETYFMQIGEITSEARRILMLGEIGALGLLMATNQKILHSLGVSSPEIDHLVKVAERAGARGAKLSGGGRGGNIIALVEPETESDVRDALLAAGAKSVIRATVS